MIIACDIDGVFANFEDAFRDLARSIFGDRPVADYKPSDWNWSDSGLTPEEISIAWERLKATDDFWLRLQSYHDVAPYLVKRAYNEAVLLFPTSRVPSAGLPITQQSSRWLANAFGIDFPTVFVTSNKGPLAAALKYDYFIDDRDKNVIDVKDASPSTKVYLLDKPYNQSVTRPDIIRVKTVNEFLRRALAGV